jgi:hypothetical protein
VSQRGKATWRMGSRGSNNKQQAKSTQQSTKLPSGCKIIVRERERERESKRERGKREETKQKRGESANKVKGGGTTSNET